MASSGRGRTAVEDNRRNADANGSSNAMVPVQQHGPVVLSALGRVAGTAWSALKLCHRYVLAPTAVWVLRNVKAYIDEQLAIQRAMGRPCDVPLYVEAEVRLATDELSFTRRALGTPYGMIVYLTQLRGAKVAVRQVQLHRLQDVEAFWGEAAAGRALLSAGRHAHVVPYAGCCPPLACHVYEQRPGTCSLREALLSSSVYGSALGSWEVRVAMCRQLISAAVHLLQSGICARELSATHIILSLTGDDCGSGEDPGRASSSSTPLPDRGPRCWLAPGCEFRLDEAAVPQSEEAWQQQPASPGRGGQPPAAATSAGRLGVEAAGSEEFVAMGRALGVVLFQVVAGADSPVPPASTVLRTLAEMTPTRLLSTAVAPPLTDDQAWPLLAAVYSLMNWRAGAQEPGFRGAAGRTGTGGGRGVGAAGGTAAGGSTGPASECARALLHHLTQEVTPVVEDVQFQIQWAAPLATAPPATAQAQAGPGPGAPPPAPPSPSGDDAFNGASAPPLPVPLQPTPPPPSPSAAGCVTPPRPTAGATSAAAPPPAPPLPPAALPGPASDTSRQGPPEELLCPITTDLMTDPVVAADGHSYERAAIARWLSARPSRPTSPLTGAVLPHSNLTPNYALRKIIGDWREKHRA